MARIFKNKEKGKEGKLSRIVYNCRYKEPSAENDVCGSADSTTYTSGDAPGKVLITSVTV